MNVSIEKATISDAKELSALTIKSKAYWGYSEEQLSEWFDDLQISEKYIVDHEVFIAKDRDRIAGYYAFKYHANLAVELDHVFIHPKNIGKGLGTILMNDFLSIMKDLQLTTVILNADPNAEKFYQKFGFKTVDQLKSSIPNRFLPKMELKLTY